MHFFWTVDSCFNQLGIKIYSTYEYKVSKKLLQLNIVKRYKTEADDLDTYTCSGDREDDAEKGIAINENITSTYSERLQKKFRKYMPASSDGDKSRMEALMAAISYKFSEFTPTSENDADDDGLVDYITGCSKKLRITDDYDKEIECLSSELKEILTAEKNDVENTLAAYYAKKTDIYNDTDKATIQDYYNWLNVLCGIENSTNTIATTASTGSITENSL